MKKLLLATTALTGLYLAWPAKPVHAQNTTCATRPQGDSSHACASTAFVQNAVVTGGIPPIGFDPVTYGGDCTGATDSTAAVQAAVAAAIAAGGGKIWIRSGCHLLISGSGADIIHATIPLTFEGADEFSSQLVVAASTSAATDIIHFAFPASSFNIGGSVKNLTIVAASGTPGRHAISLDTNAVGASSTNFLVDKVNTGQLGGFGFVATNATNVNGGVFHLMIQNSNIQGGGGCILFNNIGDSLRIYNNVLSGTGAALLSSTVSGAGNLQIVGNNISAAGMIKIDAGYKPTIAWNEIEQQVTNTEANNALIDINGGSGTVESAQIYGNQVQANPSTGNPTLLRVANAVGTYYDLNRFGTPVSYAPVLYSGGAQAEEGAWNTYNTGGTEQFKANTAFAAITSTTVANSTVNTAIGAFSSIPPYALQPGNIIRIRAAGFYSTLASSQGYGINVLMQGVAISAGPATLALTGGLTNRSWTLEQDITVRGVGSSAAAIAGYGVADFDGSYNTQTLSSVGSSATINTTLASSIQLTFQWTNASASNSITCSTFTVEVLKAGNFQ